MNEGPSRSRGVFRLDLRQVLIAHDPKPMKAIGCVLFLLIISFVAIEVWVYIEVAGAFDEYLGVALAIAASSFFGYKLVRWQAARMPAALMQNRMGQQGVAIMGAVLICFPGIISTIIGVVLQLPPIQFLFSNVAAKVVASMIKIAAERMGGQMPGGMPGAGGMPGGGAMPGGAGFPFPGMQPDQKLKGGRVFDAKAEKKD